MFSLEITFSDGVSPPEMVLIRRPQAVIGSSDFAHVVIEDMKSLDYQLRIIRDLGNSFRTEPVGLPEGAASFEFLKGVYEGNAVLDLGVISLDITCLDIDLILKEAEPPDRAGVRILRQACATDVPRFPALVTVGSSPIILSFAPDQPVYVGRSNKCALRLDSADISAQHARIGFESGEFWVEDLGSTNGTFVEGQQVSGKMRVKPGVSIVLGREIRIVGVVSEDQLHQITSRKRSEKIAAPQDDVYPVLISLSDLVRPARLSIKPDSTLHLGRDPSNDIWIGAPHISRRHCIIKMDKKGGLQITDLSTNGINSVLGKLVKNVPYEVSGSNVLDFGGNITIGICFSKEDEKSFITKNGGLNSFDNPNALKLSDDSALTKKAGVRAWSESHHVSKNESFLGEDTGQGNLVMKCVKAYLNANLWWKLLISLVLLCVLIVVAMIGQIIYGGL